MPPKPSKLAGIFEQAKSEPVEEQAPIPGKTYAPHSKTKPAMPIIAKRDWAWNVDSFFYQLPRETKKRAIFCAVEMTSRKAFARAYVKTEGETAEARTANAKGAVANLKTLREAYKVNLVQADKGTEFKNGLVEAWAKAQDPPVELYYTQTGVKNEAAMVESFNANLRHLLDLYAAEKAKRKGAGYEDFNSFLEKSVEAYNNAKSEVLNASPASVDESKMGYVRLVLADRGSAYLKKLDAIQPGDVVRVWDAVDPRLSGPELTTFNFAHKGRHKWIDDQLFEVVDLSGYKVIVKDKGGSEPYERRLSPRDIQVVGSKESTKDVVGPEPDVEAKAAAVERRSQAVLQKAGLGPDDKPWDQQAKNYKEPRAKRAPKPSAAILESKEQQRRNRRSLPTTARQEGAVRITGYDVDDEKGEAVFYVVYPPNKGQYAVNVKEFYNTERKEWDPVALAFFKTSAAEKNDARGNVVPFV